MIAHHLIESAVYGPEALKAMTRAFDEAWLVIAGNFSADASEAGRLRLARAIMSVASDDSRDVKAMKIGALAAMALSYRAVPPRISK